MLRRTFLQMIGALGVAPWMPKAKEPEYLDVGLARRWTLIYGHTANDANEWIAEYCKDLPTTEITIEGPWS